MEMPETMRHKGDMMGAEGRDQFLEEVDQALRSINARLKKAFLETEVLLKEHFKERPETQEPDDEQAREG
jgi:truncated hemoglobin YjbI